ncbi:MULTISPECIES: single-stranded DNA-binding protein [unclassified Lentimonas]|uniref:single-stranded DNA-binding protein n=1 Tax=unclassified Lentimonas TaxID=2630993 RepID=UPI00132502C7|nr:MULTISPECIES: single-stranded DNA-binding protein [unclassified Lentimonas]CAA6677492.1 Single-stranded DNA-binding protein [Lentimonas sp. CC4]CAA6686462.1 Single-stranded DNA-binding protein [Lentimonas sp. CC6]CAA6690268.1 Single-stranded DNA-binding protein [Lentimonas sp. CC19]CAA6690802.1 Single-stranded DNA-binding protein [Lentimonas sp. CC10]CAA7068531.1 Single-stranded DNA-binding protein [Lentimonas sp. CC11]
MNQTILSGNLTAEIETREVGEQHLSKFTLACNEGDRVVFLPVECWNMPHLADYLSKGSKVLVSGSLKQDNWETEGGEKRSRILLTGYKVEFLSPQVKGGSQSTASSARRPSRQASRSAAA